MKLLIAIAFPLIIFTGCASRQNYVPTNEQPVKNSHFAGSVEPITLEIADEYNDGRQLSVLAKVKAMQELPYSNVLLRLSGLENGKIVRSRDFRIGKDTELFKKLVPGEERKVAMFLDSSGITDYQLELFWGESAKKLEKVGKAIIPGNTQKALRLKNLQVQTKRVPCNVNYCAMKFKINGELLNEGNDILNHVILGVSLVGKLDSSPSIPQNEERLELKDLHLFAGQSKTLEIEIDQEIPEGMIDQYQPKIRILEFN